MKEPTEQQNDLEVYDDLTFNDNAGADDGDMITSWYTVNNQDYFLAYTTTPHIPHGLYTITFSEEFGMGLSRINYDADEIFVLPGMPYTNIINDLITFWNSAEKFKAFNLKPHRGILLHGETGCGKTSLIYKLIDEIKVFDGIVIQFTDPIAWIRMIPIIHRLEADRPIICFIEDLDKILERYGEERFLMFLDGANSISNMVYIATTNNLAVIPDRIKNRPSRFDRKYEITKPNDLARKEYLRKKIPCKMFKKHKLTQLVSDTNGFSMAHLREFVVSVFIFGNNYNETITTLNKIKNISSSPKFLSRIDK